MTEQLTFRASRWKAVLILLGSLAFVAIGYFLRAEEPLIAWACMIFFGLGIPVSLFMMFAPNSMYLHLDPEGFEMSGAVKKLRVKMD